MRSCQIAHNMQLYDDVGDAKQTTEKGGGTFADYIMYRRQDIDLKKKNY